MAERYDVAKHGSRQWQDFNPLLRPSWPTKRGYYDVIVSRRNHWWVERCYFWTGDIWTTARNSPTSTVIKYDPATRSEERASR